MPDEVELKYAVDDPDAIVALLDDQLPPADGEAGWQTVELTDTYIDTAERALARAGYGARLRRTGSRTTVGLKSDVEVDGALVWRAEIEGPATAALDPAAWPDSEAKRLICRLAGSAPLVDRFVLRQQRRQRRVGGVELSVDAVSVRHGRREVGRLSELEVEKKSGRRAELRRLARTIERSGLARAEPRSKMELAAVMVEGPPPVYPLDRLAEAGRKVLGRLLDRLLERESAMRGGDIVALKQMRVTTRRMRATWRAVDGAYRRADERRYVAELRGVARRLGAVRDLDVLLEKLPADDSLGPLRDAWTARRESAWQDLLATIDSVEYADFVGDYRAFAATPASAATKRGLSEHVAESAASRIWTTYETVRAAQPQLDPPPAPEDLHALRISARQFRYTLEVYRDLLDGPATSQLLARLVAMQDLIGELNDADVAAHEVAAWLALQLEAAPAVDAYRAQLERDVSRLTASVGRAVDGVVGLPFRRLLGRAVAAI